MYIYIYIYIYIPGTTLKTNKDENIRNKIEIKILPIKESLIASDSFVAQ